MLQPVLTAYVQIGKEGEYLRTHLHIVAHMNCYDQENKATVIISTNCIFQNEPHLLL